MHLWRLTYQNMRGMFREGFVEGKPKQDYHYDRKGWMNSPKFIKALGFPAGKWRWSYTVRCKPDMMLQYKGLRHGRVYQFKRIQGRLC